MDTFEVFSFGWFIAAAIVLIWFWNSLFIIKEWERGAVLRLAHASPPTLTASPLITCSSIHARNRSRSRAISSHSA